MNLYNAAQLRRSEFCEVGVILASFYRWEVEKQVTKLPMNGDSGRVVVKRGKGKK